MKISSSLITKENLEAELPPFELVLGGGAPVYTREQKEPSYIKEKRTFDFLSLPEPKNIQETFLKVFSSPNIASKKWVYEQYDSMVRTNTIVGPGCDSAVIYIKGTNKALAMKTDCNARYVYLKSKRRSKDCSRRISEKYCVLWRNSAWQLQIV